jgi:hypothetical protein
LADAEPPSIVRGGEACDHDWAEAVGVELDLELSEARVVVCRLCGLYAVEERT